MREPEGVETPPPGQPSERTWSKGREPYVRIVEVGGSSPLTSTICHVSDFLGHVNPQASILDLPW